MEARTEREHAHELPAHETTVATHLVISATLADGRPYSNEGMQLLRLRWGRVVEDLIFEDTLKLDAVLRRFARREPTPVA